MKYHTKLWGQFIRSSHTTELKFQLRNGKKRGGGKDKIQINEARTQEPHVKCRPNRRERGLGAGGVAHA